MELLDHEAEIEKTIDASTTTDTTSPITETAAEETSEMPEFDEEKVPQTVAQLLDKLKAVADSDIDNINADDISRFKQQFYHLRSEANQASQPETADIKNETETADPEVEIAEITVDNNVPDSEEETFKSLINQIKEKKAARRAQIEAMLIANLERKNAIIEDINAMSADTDNVNRHYQRVKELQTEFKAIGDVPQQNFTENWKQYQDAIEHFYDQWKVNKELRDYDFKKNLGEKQLIIDAARKLADEPDVVVAFRRLQELHDKWRGIGPVAKEFREEIWATFKDLSAETNKRYQAFFEERKKREQENEAAKTALCERIEAIDMTPLKSYATWNQATAQIVEAQEEWKKLGYASRKTNNALFSRFRKRCDEFFAAKAAFFQNLKDDLSKNLAAKTELCEKAESLMNSTEWKKTTDKMVELQKQWKTIGAVPRKQSDAIWNRFNAACDHFFQQKKESTSSTRKAELANLTTKRQIVEQLTALNSPEATEPRENAIERIHALRKQWQETGHVPFREKDKLHDTYREVVRQLFDKYDIHENRARQASFEASLNNMSADKQKLSRERERLMRAYEARRNDLATYENNLGFFNARSRSGDSMLRDVQRNIERLKADMSDLERKIDLIDSLL